MKGVHHTGISPHTFKAEAKFIIIAIPYNRTLTAKCNKIELRRNQEQSPVNKKLHYHIATGRNNDTSMLLYLYKKIIPNHQFKINLTHFLWCICIYVHLSYFWMLAVSCYKCEATLSLFLTAQWQWRLSKELGALHPVNHYSYIRASDSDQGKTSNSMHSFLPASKHYTSTQLPCLPTFSTSQRLGVQVFETTLATDLIGLQG